MEFEGVVIRGQGYAGRIGVPTINISAEGVSGIFAAYVTIEGKEYCAVAYGDSKREILEAHLFDFTEDAVGKKVRIKMVKKLRSDMAFSDEAKLHAQIMQDVEIAKQFFTVKA